MWVALRAEEFTVREITVVTIAGIFLRIEDTVAVVGTGSTIGVGGSSLGS